MRELWWNGHFIAYPQGRLLHRRYFIRHVGVLGVTVGQFKLERTKLGAFLFISPIYKNSSGNGIDYQAAFCLSRNNLFSLCKKPRN